MSEITGRLTVALADRYKIERHIGEGGMATVYLAQDMKHDRKVALKVLRPELAAVIGAERFLNEIKVTANLQHPHILPLHDSGDADGFLFYVMPYVEGETLRETLDREKQLGIEEAIEIARSVAAALDYAHRHDVIHRDIKPANILIHDGQALVADFGIALAVRQAGGTRLTETGLSIGTPHYMSPEQAMGDRELDARSDVYSLGAMLYEMLAGDPPYTGSTAQAIVAKVITEKAPSIAAVRDTVPHHVAAAIQKALNKLPADRFHSAAEFAEALVTPGMAVPSDGGPGAIPGIVAAARPPRVFTGRQFAAVSGVAVLATVVALWGWVRPGPASLVSRFAVGIPEGQQLFTGQGGTTIAFSPDGTQLVYVGPDRQLFVREMGQLAATPLPGTEGARTPFFSPDGRWLGFYARNTLKKVSVSGGPPLTIATGATAFRGASWGPDDVIVYTPTAQGGLYQVSVGGGQPVMLTVPDTAAGESSHRWPEVLPNGNAVVFTVFSGSMAEAHIAVYSFDTQQVKHLPVTGIGAHYAETGHLVYVTADGSLVAVPFDIGALEVTGPPVSILEGLMVRATLAPEFTLSRTGSLAYVTGLPPDRSLVLVDRHGVEELVVRDLQGAAAPRVSPDGKRLVLELREGGDEDLWIYDLEEETTTRLTFEGSNRYPVWTRDGARIAFSSQREGSPVRSLFWKPSDGSGVAELLFEASPAVQWESLWMPDGQALIARRVVSGPTGMDIWIVPLEHPDSARPFLQTEFSERSAAISPNGRWLAYVSDESGRDEVYVRPLPGPGGKRQVSTDGATEPLWSDDGSELFYRSGSEFLAASIQTDPVFAVGTRQVLFEDEYVRNSNHTNYDVHPGDGRFLMIKGAEAPTELIIALNWFEELKEKMGN